jgi:hypothetical protein
MKTAVREQVNPQVGFDRIMLHFKLSDGDIKNINGWAFTTKTGRYGTNYLQRSLVTVIGLGANLPQDAVYPFSQKDDHGNAYSGANKYVAHFPKGATPPAKGFWSITMYDKDYFFVANPLNRYSISMRQNPKFNADGSLDLYIQNESPGEVVSVVRVRFAEIDTRNPPGRIRPDQANSHRPAASIGMSALGGGAVGRHLASDRRCPPEAATRRELTHPHGSRRRPEAMRPETGSPQPVRFSVQRRRYHIIKPLLTCDSSDRPGRPMPRPHDELTGS